MKIFITGIAGFIGYHLARKLFSQGHHVFGIDSYNDYYDVSLKKSRAAKLDDLGIEVSYGDLAASKFKTSNWEVSDWHDKLDGVDAVIHLACISNDPSFELNPNLGKSINLDACPELVSISKFNKIKKLPNIILSPTLIDLP